MRGLMSEAFQTVNFNGTHDEILAELKAGGGLRASSSLDGMEFKMDGKAEEKCLILALSPIKPHPI